MLVIQWCPALCNSMDCSPSRLLSSVHGILQARILEWGVIPFSRVSSQHRDQTWVTCIADTFFFFLPSESPRKPRCIFIEVSVQFSRSVVSDSATPWIVASQASLSITNSQSLHKLMSIESVMPSNHLILCCPLLLPPSIFPSIRIFSNESVLLIRWPKCWEFQLQHQSFQWIFKIDFL